jgi:uncharacterized protein YfbU (UPF0304 family)
MTYARFLEGQGRWADVIQGNAGHGVDSLDEYERMIEEWKKSPDKVNLTKDDIQRIVAAQTHPDNR